MKFGQYLSENLVPEWKLQYLDYKTGKKKLKNIDKEKNARPGVTRRGTLASLFHSTPILGTQTPGVSNSPSAGFYPIDEQSFLSNSHESPVISRQNQASNISSRSGVTSSFPLKAPPKTPSDREERNIQYSPTDPLTISPVDHNMAHYGTINCDYEFSRSPNTYTPHDKALSKSPGDVGNFKLPPPAIEHTNSNSSPLRSEFKKSRPDYSRSNSSLRKRDPKIYRSGSFVASAGASSKAIPTNVCVDETNPKTSRKNSQNSIINVLEDPYKSTNPLNDSERDFLSWADSQLDMVNEFYKEREKEAVQRYNLIHIHLHKLLEQKNLAKQANKPATSRLEQIQKKLDFPSFPTLKIFLPEVGGNKLKIKKATSELSVSPEISTDNTPQGRRNGIMEKEKFGISYIQARTQLKLAVIEFYRSLELLKTYKSLNLTAFQKNFKKFDKTTGRKVSPWYMDKVRKSYFSESHKLDDLITKVENIFSYYFENGNRKQAVERLRSKDRPDNHYSAMFVSGLFLGMAVPFFLLASIRGGHRIFDGSIPHVKYIFQLWGGFFLVLLFLLLFTVNCAVWVKYKINYPFIFEFDIHNHLDFRELCLIPSFLMFLMSLLAWLSFENFWPDTFSPIWFPPIFLGISAFILLVPLPIFQWRARKWLLLAILRLLLSGFYPIEFRDFFLGDIFGSLTYSISNMALLTCLYNSDWANPTMCNSSHSKVLGFFNTLPGIWRFLQCIRRYTDTGDWFPHLANMLKYSFTIIYYMTLSIYRIEKTSSHRSLFIFFATINSVYCSIWDILMDWSLLQPGSKNVLLRDNLGFKSKWPYYFAISIDPIIRFNWIFYILFVNQLQQSQLVSFFIALSEIFRRFIWVFIRMENEHCTNVGNLKAARDLPLPYTSIIYKEIDSSGKSLNDNEPAPFKSQDEESYPGLQPISELTTNGKLSQPQVTPFSADTTLNGGLSAAPVKPANAADLPDKSNESVRSRWRLAGEKVHVLDAFSSILREAHAADFERRRSESDKDLGDSDDDDELDDSYGPAISEETDEGRNRAEDDVDSNLGDLDDEVQEADVMGENDEPVVEGYQNQTRYFAREN